MASWVEFEAAEPEFAKRVRKLMTRRKHLTMATLRRDGSPRISGTEIQFVDGQLRIGSMTGAVKAMDLRRDPRVAIHGPSNDPTKTGAWRGEAKIAGRAIELEAEGGHAFRIDIAEAVITRLGGKGLIIESWSPERGHRSIDRA
ncbi:MAG TPA: pyridoxamine 5'-phosphate oxidase family protein [Candidatus Dormibacteraeota bacterium]|nr:pyridoxamine 5'-phosphate oxidase family protein [Candidatus Dormibacteraeota bacterium]